MKDFQLTENFWLSEFLKSVRAAKEGICTGEEHCIEPTTQQIIQLTLGAALLWQLTRDDLGPMTVTGGIRFDELNTLLGGAPNSAHLTGDGADFFFHQASPREVMEYLGKRKIPFDQAIYYPSTEHIHLGRIHPTKKIYRRERLISKDGKFVPWSG